MTQHVADSDQRTRALDVSQSFIVRAPAGSGKTELLIQRYLNLLSRVDKPESILAMTFTRKAAGEMKNRIVDALILAQNPQLPSEPHEAFTYALAKKVLQRDEELNWNILHNPARLHVQTIDSFCAKLTRQTPLISGTGGLFSLEENASDLYLEAAQDLLDSVEDSSTVGDATRYLLAHLDNNKTTFLQRIMQMLNKRAQWQWMIEHFKEHDPRQNQQDILKEIIGDYLRRADKHWPTSAKETLLPLLTQAAKNLLTEKPDDSRCILATINKFPTAKAEHLPTWKAIAGFLLTKEYQWRKSVTKNDGFPSKSQDHKNEFMGLLDSLRDNETLRKALADIDILPPADFTHDEWDEMNTMLQFLPVMKTALREIFRRRGQMDFAELSLAAIQSLGKDDDPTELLLRLDYEIKHVLVDEYQDTSYKQLLLLKLLIAGWQPDDGRTLFLVGDPMQSIYRFRDAQVSLFSEAEKNGIGDIQLESLKLSTNFRSQKKVVDWVNDCFGALLPSVTDSEQLVFESTSYAPSSAYWPPESDQVEGVAYHPLRDNPDEEEAEEIFRLVADLRLRYKDKSVALLVRARNHLRDIVRRFNEAHIPFKAEGIDPLTSRPEILDLLALLRALLSPLDRVSWLSVLRATWCGLSLEDLHRLCFDDPDSPILEIISRPDKRANLSPDGQIRLNRILPALNDALKSRHASDFRDLLEGCWIALSGPACIQPSALQDTQVFFDKVSEIVDAEGIQGLHRFDEILNELYARPIMQESNPVHILTMHKAKGLEFDFVILPGLGRKAPPAEKHLVLWMPYGEKLLIAPIEKTGSKSSPIYRFLKAIDKDKSDFETRRLLYVSATRAKMQLHLFGHCKTNKSGEPSPHAGSLLAKLWGYVSQDWLDKLKAMSARQGKHAVTADEHITVRRIPSGFSPPPVELPIVLGLSTEISDVESKRPEYFWAGREARCLGSVLHRVFNDIAHQGPKRWPKERVDALQPRLESALMAEGLSQDTARDMASKGVLAVRKTLLDEKGRWILSHHQDHTAEYSMTANHENRFVTRIVDRTFIDESGTRWIIDYKSGEHQGRDLEGFLLKEKERYRGQLEGYAELFRLAEEDRPIKMALYYPLHQRLVEIP
jgi:ATP-dependent exoDNAse (exonuclease V) beta subunit